MKVNSPSSNVEAEVPAGPRVMPAAGRAARGPQQLVGALVAGTRQYALGSGQGARAHRQHLQQDTRCLQRPGQ